jgi:protein ImuB
MAGNLVSPCIEVALWLCLYLPDWPLQVATRGLSEPLPLVLQQRSRVSHCNQTAVDAGIRTGMKLSTAYALVAGLRTMEHDPHHEQVCLERVAAWAYTYSDQVVPADNAILLEAGGSLRLWGPLPALLEQLQEGLDGLGYRANIGVAPTAAGARVFAPRRLVAMEPQQLHRYLQPLPLVAGSFDSRLQQKLQRAGITTFGELIGLPRAALQQRFGQVPGEYLDRIMGTAPDRHSVYEPPARYQGDLAMPAPIKASEGLLFAGRRLLEELCGHLTGLDASVQTLRWRLEHEDRKESHFSIGLASPDRDLHRWLAVLREHLSQWRLPAPVNHLYLDAEQLLVFRPRQTDLLNGSSQEENRDYLLERVRGRLGNHSVTSIGVLSDHRPEKSWVYGRSAADRPIISSRRPLWLLPEPEIIDPAELCFLTRAERIETGWWDGNGYTRDYFVADHPDGRRLWVFQQHKPVADWFIHGIFG